MSVARADGGAGRSTNAKTDGVCGLSVFEHFEIRSRKSLDDLSAFVGDDRIDLDEVRVGPESHSLLRLGSDARGSGDD